MKASILCAAGDTGVAVVLLTLIALAGGCTTESPATSTPDEAPSPPSVASVTEELRQVRADVRAAYESSDATRLFELLERGRELQPTSPLWTYNLASVHASHGRPDEALAWIRRTYDLGALFDYSRDSDFAALVDDGRLDVFAGATKALTTPIGRASRGFSLETHDLIAEAVAHDAARERFLVSSVHRRKILSVDADGQVADFVPTAAHGLGAVLGIAVDAERGMLWACSAPLPEMIDRPGDEKIVPSLYRFALEDAALISRHPLPPHPDGPMPNDLVVLRGGDVLVSDSRLGAIYRVAPDGATEVETLVPPGTLRSPQGLTVLSGASTVAVADYSLGLIRLDAATGEVRFFDVPEGPTLVGIDGLSRHATGLIAIQNGIRPARVVRIRLSGDERAVERIETLERAHPDFDEPTTGAVVGDDFYFVANSHWGGTDESHDPLPADRLSDHLILRLGLAPSDPRAMVLTIRVERVKTDETLALRSKYTS